MQNIQPSSIDTENPEFKKDPRNGRENNLDWLKRVVPTNAGLMIVLVGGTDNLSFRLRVAQSHARSSFTPSHWSHCFLTFGLDANAGATPIYEISLDPPDGFGYPAARNALQKAALKRYADRKRYPNIAAIALPGIDPEACPRLLRKFAQQRAILDAVDLTLRWLGYAWGVGASGNPLLDGNGLPSAAMIEIICNAAGYDITPNTPSRASSPEAIWQATKWWYRFPRAVEAESPPAAEDDIPRSAPYGWYNVEHELGDQPDEWWWAR